MLITDLVLENFRTYQKQRISFAPTVTCFVGPNTIGKTNILEALYAMATSKSFRADADREMIRWEKELLRINGITSSDTLELLITTGSVGGQKTPLKRHLVNGVPRRAMDFVGKFKAVLFAPEDLLLVTGSPSLRRRFLDAVLIQVDRDYRRNLQSYEKGVRQRNKVLFQIHEGVSARSQLFYWDQLLIKTGGYITDARAALIDYINSCRLQVASYQLTYDKSVISESRLEQYKDAEVAAKVTLVGPHRDDFLIEVENVELSKYGSRGEQRLGVLWLKLAELSYIMNRVNDRPVLLLDDIFSELDEAHARLVMEVVKTHQTIITSADEQIIPVLEHAVPTATIIHLPFEGGRK